MTEPTMTAETFAADLSPRYLHCRELGHTWRAWGVSHEPANRCYVRTLRCSSCKTERHMVVDYRGHIVSSHYTYPARYLAKHLERGTFSRDVFRLEAITRELDPNQSQGKAS